MPVDRFFLILFGVMLAAGLTIGAAAVVSRQMDVPGAVPALAPLALIAAALLRIATRRRRDLHAKR